MIIVCPGRADGRAEKNFSDGAGRRTACTAAVQRCEKANACKQTQRSRRMRCSSKASKQQRCKAGPACSFWSRFREQHRKSIRNLAEVAPTRSDGAPRLFVPPPLVPLANQHHHRLRLVGWCPSRISQICIYLLLSQS